MGKEYLTCKCKYCNTISRGGGSGSASVSKSTKKASSKAVDPKLKVKANIQAYLDAEHNERVAESQVEGWVFRKGEIVWVWSADEDITNFDHATASGMTENWAAGIVIENPPEAPSLLVMPPNEPRKFIANDGKPLE